VTRDIAMVVPLNVTHATIVATLEGANEPLLISIELFDVFTDVTGTRIPADRRSLAYSLTYRSAERTLTAEEVSAAHGRLKEQLLRELAVTLRE
jgi:phenylalanyl-tRNA synthetase beta chain